MLVYPQIKCIKLVICSVIKEISFKQEPEKKLDKALGERRPYQRQIITPPRFQINEVCSSLTNPLMNVGPLW